MADPSAEDLVIEVEGFQKSFGPTKALDGLDLQVRRGEVHGFLGPNGAGKSTTIRALLGLIRVDAGRASVLGQDPWQDTVAIHRRLAYVPGDVALWPNLTGGEIIDMLVRMRGGDPAHSRKHDLLERFQLDPRKKGRAYSKGNRQKVALVAALAVDAELLILDEPTSGLDPLMEKVFADSVVEAVRGGATVLLSSHILSEVERMCERVTIIRSGRTVETGALADLRHLRRTRVTAELTGRFDTGRDLPGVHDLRVEDHRLTCTVEPEGLTPLLERLTAAGVRGLTSTPPSLEELFLAAYQDQ